MLESKFQSQLVKKIKKNFDGCIVLKNDPNYIQGMPDLLILHKNKWAALECKQDEKAHHQPNQEYYVDMMNNMSFAAFVCPENEEDILNALQETFRS